MTSQPEGTGMAIVGQAQASPSHDGGRSDARGVAIDVVIGLCAFALVSRYLSFQSLVDSIWLIAIMLSLAHCTASLD